MTLFYNKFNGKIIPWLFFILVISMISSSWATDTVEEQANIRLVQKVEVAGDDVLLGDIADINGDNQNLVEELQAVYMGKSPLPGKSRRINADYILMKLKQNNIDTTMVQITGKPEVEIYRGSTTISEHEIEQIVFKELPGAMGIGDDEFTIKEVKAANAVSLPQGAYTYSVVPAKNPGLSGKMLVSVIFDVGEKFTKKVFATVEVERYVDAVLLISPLQKNQIIQESDIETRKLNISDLPNNFISRIEDAVGNRVRRDLNQGVILTMDFIDVPHAINKNDIVFMVAETNNFKIVTLGEALEKGRKGERIKVKNIDSKNEIFAWVVDSKSVRVGF